jgi:uncharacterized small protein (DUF1192 family)
VRRLLWHADNIAAAVMTDLAEIVLGIRTLRRRLADLSDENAQLRAELASKSGS